MWIIFIIIGWFVVKGLMNMARGRDSELSESESQHSELKEMGFRVKKATQDIEGHMAPVLEFQVKGIIPHRLDYEDLQLSVILRDTTDDDIGFVISSLDGFQEDTTALFLYRTELEDFELGSGFTDWVTIGGAFIETLSFPRQGFRNIQAHLFVSPYSEPVDFEYSHPTNPDACYTYETATVRLDIEEPGYVERKENRKVALMHIVELAMCMSAADGELDKSEGKVIKDWIKRMVNTQSDDEQEEYKKELNKALTRCFGQARQHKLFDRLGEIISDINTHAQDTEKYEAIELIVEVMTADGKADQSELELLDHVTTELGLDPDKVRSMRDRKLVDVDEISVDKDDLGSLLGITDDMDKAAIRKKLNQEFQRWNGRQTHADPETRKRAVEMLELIAEARKRYIG